jgi:hypothetical protein
MQYILIPQLQSFQNGGCSNFIVIVFCLMKPINMAMVRNFDFMVGQTLNHS